MKKTIASVALLAASSTSFAMIHLPIAEKPTTICLKQFKAADRSNFLGGCDESDNNAELNKKIKANGCAAGQAAIVTYGELNIGKCMPPGAVQL